MGGLVLFYSPNRSNAFVAASRWRKDFTFRITDLKFSRVAALGGGSADGDLPWP